MQSYRRTAFAGRIHSLHTIFTAHSPAVKVTTDAMNTITWHSIICKNIVHSWKKYGRFSWKAG